MKNFVTYISLILLISFHSTVCLKILGIFPYEGKSHFFVFKTLLDELTRRGHDLTIISHFPRENSTPNYRDIALQSEILEGVMEAKQQSPMDIIYFLVKKGVENCKLMLANEDVQELWKTGRKFDVVVTEQFNNDCSLALAYKIGAPVVGLSSCAMFWIQYERLGIPWRFITEMPDATLLQRTSMTTTTVYGEWAWKETSKETDEIIAQYFEAPPLEELVKDLKVMLTYSYFPLTGVRLLLPNVVEVGGYHVAQPKPLVGNLKKFVEEAPHGVVYVSFGSLVKSTTLSEDKLMAIIQALSQLKQRVVWKWENDSLPGNPENILPMSWLPQNDILAHPNVVAFYSHAGMLGTTEAIHHGVPMVAMPILGDQPANAVAIQRCGLGVQLDLGDVTAESLLAALQHILQPEFRAKVKELSRVWHDRPLTPMDSAVFWVEFAARHRDHYFRSPAAEVPLYKYYSLDLWAILGGAFLLVYAACRGRGRKGEKMSKRD